jgi:murein DD-endopeptidase MepM/ murein hydrolase activator NlpD
MSASPAARLALASLPAFAARLARQLPKQRLLISVCMTASLLAALIYQISLHDKFPRSGAIEAPPGASAAIPPLEPQTESAASSPSLDSDSAPGETMAETALAPEPPAITGADIHLVPVLQPGLDMGPVLSRLNIPVLAQAAEGGPYLTITAMHATSPAARTRPRDLPPVARRLVISAPLATYHLESRFGPRRDPFNGNMAFHAGVDLVAPFRSPVYGAAPGTVIFAGIKDAYGRCIDIDHGNGLVTRYGHLDRILVSRGQHVGAHQQIALLGNTGRSTGPHLHFEVRVNNVPQDPLKFLGAKPRPRVARAKAVSTDSD